MACGMQREPHLPNLAAFPVAQRFDANVAKAFAQNWRAILVTEIGAAAPSRVIGVRMRNHRKRHRAPWIDVKVSGRAAEAFCGRDNQILGHLALAGKTRLAPFELRTAATA